MGYIYKLFESISGEKYLYDGVSGNIFSVSDNFFTNYKEIFKYAENKRLDVPDKHQKDVNDLIKEIKQHEIIASESEKIEYWFDKEQYKKESMEMVQLMFGVTERCNFRCKYCVYGGHYKNERVHGSKDASYDMMKKAVDVFFRASTAEKKIVNFYGGEPFVNFKSIEKIVEYIKNIDNSVRVYITTNGSLIDDDIVKWFLNNKMVYLFVSLAGIPKTHDKLRVFSNGSPSFEIIENNLYKIYNLDRNEYNRRVNFIINIFNEQQLFEIEEFRQKHELLNNLDNLPEVTFIDCYDDDGNIKEMSKTILDKYQVNKRELLDKYIFYLTNKQLNNLIVKVFDDKFLRIHRRTDDTRNLICGVCRPFIKKVYIDVDGNIHLCENFSYGKKFGNINNIINLNLASQLLEEYQKIRNKMCRQCWAQKMCTLCYRDVFDRNGNVNIERAKKSCEAEKGLIEEIMEEYCYVMERNEDLLDHLDEYILYD